MIGWWIGVAQQTPQVRDDSVDKKAAIIASWEAGSGGLDWLEKLVQEGKATKLSHHGYPCRYVALARDVLPLIAEGPPVHTGPTIIGDDYVTPGGWIGNVELHSEKIAACAPDETLTIDAWDLD
jgi:hypothetical protein